MDKGFTLVETLITLGIIGVVAAITIPNLQKSYFEKNSQHLKRNPINTISGNPNGWRRKRRCFRLGLCVSRFTKPKHELFA